MEAPCTGTAGGDPCLRSITTQEVTRVTGQADSSIAPALHQSGQVICSRGGTAGRREGKTFSSIDSRMKLVGLRVNIILLFSAGFIARISADDCQDQFQAAGTPIEATRGTVKVTDSDKITPHCRPVVFSSVFPSQACNVNEFPAPGSAVYAPPHLLRQASLFALQEIERASNLEELALSQRRH